MPVGQVVEQDEEVSLTMPMEPMRATSSVSTVEWFSGRRSVACGAGCGASWVGEDVVRVAFCVGNLESFVNVQEPLVLTYLLGDEVPSRGTSSGGVTRVGSR